SSTSVRLWPTPCRLTLEPPEFCPPSATCWVELPENTGSVLRLSIRFAGERVFSSSATTDVTGVGVNMPGACTMREPVTRTSCSSSWASAGTARASATAAATVNCGLFRLIIKPPSLLLFLRYALQMQDDHVESCS